MFVKPDHRIRWVGVLLLVLVLQPAAGPACKLRVVSLAPNITEILFRLGVGPCVVGRTDFCRYPQEATRLPSVGGYLNPDYEKMAALAPDVIFLLPNPDMEARLHQMGWRTVTVPDETLEDIFSGIQTIGRIVGVEKRAGQLVQQLRDSLALFAGRSQEVSALLVVGHRPGKLASLYVAGGRTYLSELWEWCGGRNVFRDQKQRYFPASLEAVLAADPEVILEFQPEGSLTGWDRQQLLKDWQSLKEIKAVQHGHVYLFSHQYFLIPGPRIVLIARSFSRILRQQKATSP